MATRIVILGSASNTTNLELVRCWRRLGLRARLVAPLRARAPVGHCDIVLGRLDVLPALDGVEPLAAHDKLLTARRLAAARLPHARAAAWRGDGAPPLDPPLVLKPRFGSWGRDVFLCTDEADLERTLASVRLRPWFRRHGALLQELIPSRGWDLRLIVAGEGVIAAAERVAAPGEWRTNVSLGGILRPAEPSAEARSLAVAAAAAIGSDLVGVDLLPLEGDRYVIVELNGAVEFDERYSIDGRNPYVEAARALRLEAPEGVRPVLST
jgi:glutathione synthase/RimK-type ligase-like ATP-grasp enzyme